jgi:hypothetical protein
LPHVADGQVAFDGERQGEAEQFGGVPQPALLDVEIGEVAVPTRVDLVEVLVGRPKDCQRRFAAATLALQHIADALDQPRPHGERRIVDAGRDFGGSSNQNARSSDVVGLHGEIGLQCKGVAEVRVRAQRGIALEHDFGCRGVQFRDVPVSVVPLVHRQGVMVDADAGRVLAPLAKQHRSFAGCDGVVESIDQVILAGEQLEQLRLIHGRLERSPLERGPEEGSRLRVRAGSRRGTTGVGRMTQRASCVSGAHRVMGQHGRVRVR